MLSHYPHFWLCKAEKTGEGGDVTTHLFATQLLAFLTACIKKNDIFGMLKKKQNEEDGTAFKINF